ncbi:UNVERIFIED_CONTAM: hypothetical protein GTU68_057569 [Idotea baltica]|nr:hypothetical protein [Idotea baltica]
MTLWRFCRSARLQLDTRWWCQHSKWTDGPTCPPSRGQRWQRQAMKLATRCRTRSLRYALGR